MSTELFCPLLLKERPEDMSGLTHGTVVFIVVLAVVQNEFHVVREFFALLVLIAAHLLAHRGEIHRMLDAFVVLGMLVGIDRQLEGPRCVALGQLSQNHSKLIANHCHLLKRQRSASAYLQALISLLTVDLRAGVFVFFFERERALLDVPFVAGDGTPSSEPAGDASCRLRTCNVSV